MTGCRKNENDFRVMREGIGKVNVKLLYIIHKWQKSITTGSKWMMYSDVCQVKTKKKTTKYEKFQEDMTQIEKVNEAAKFEI